jgi:hypothetical protein
VAPRQVGLHVAALDVVGHRARQRLHLLHAQRAVVQRQQGGLDLGKGLAHAGELDADVVGAAVLHQADLLGAGRGPPRRRGGLQDLEQRLELAEVEAGVASQGRAGPHGALSRRLQLVPVQLLELQALGGLLRD